MRGRSYSHTVSTLIRGHECHTSMYRLHITTSFNEGCLYCSCHMLLTIILSTHICFNLKMACTEYSLVLKCHKFHCKLRLLTRIFYRNVIINILNQKEKYSQNKWQISQNALMDCLETYKSSVYIMVSSTVLVMNYC